MVDCTRRGSDDARGAGVREPLASLLAHESPRSRRRAEPPSSSLFEPSGSTYLAGMNSVNVLPRCGVLSTRISPPSRRAISRLIESPSPVPPNFRLVVPSACWKASKMSCCLSFAMPMPVSSTMNAITVSA